METSHGYGFVVGLEEGEMIVLLLLAADLREESGGVGEVRAQLLEDGEAVCDFGVGGGEGDTGVGLGIFFGHGRIILQVVTFCHGLGAEAYEKIVHFTILLIVSVYSPMISNIWRITRN